MNSIGEVIGLWGEKPFTAARALSDEIGADVQAVRSWAKRGRVPSQWIVPIVNAARRRRFSGVSAELLARLSMENVAAE